MSEAVRKKKPVRKKKRKMTPLLKVFCLVLIAASVYMLVGVGREIMTTISLQQQLTEVQTQLQKVQDENDYLNDEKTKLQDPDYVENYARGKYMLSKEGEQIFHLPEDSDK